MLSGAVAEFCTTTRHFEGVKGGTIYLDAFIVACSTQVTPTHYWVLTIAEQCLDIQFLIDRAEISVWTASPEIGLETQMWFSSCLHIVFLQDTLLCIHCLCNWYKCMLPYLWRSLSRGKLVCQAPIPFVKVWSCLRNQKALVTAKHSKSEVSIPNFQSSPSASAWENMDACSRLVIWRVSELHKHIIRL